MPVRVSVKHCIFGSLFHNLIIILKDYICNSRFLLCFCKFNSDKWAATWQNQQSECAPSKDSDQPGHPPSLIRVFAVCMKKAWVLSHPMSAQRRLWSDWRTPKLIWVFAGRTVSLLVLLWGGSNARCITSWTLHNLSLSTETEQDKTNIHPGWSESSMGAQVILLVLSCSG